MPANILIQGIQIVLLVQGLGAWLKAPMNFFSFLGYEQFYLFIAPAILWCLDATLGLRFGLILTISGGFNLILKIAFHQPRPFWYDTRVQGLASENSFGIPSGHAQNSVVVWGLLAAWIHKTWAWIVAILIIFFIGLSRIYLGVHFPTDILFGWLIGGIILWLFLRFEKPVTKWFQHQSLPIQILSAFFASILFILLGWLAKKSLGDWQLPNEWIQNAALAFPNNPISPLDLSRVVTLAGVFFGIALGGILIHFWGGFNAGGPILQRILRFLVGIAGVVAIYFLLGAIFPDGETVLPLVLRYLRYGIVGVWVSGLAPYLFIKMKIAQPLRN